MGCRQSSETKPTRPVDPKSIPSESQNARQDASFNELSNRDDARQNTSKTDPPLKDTHHPSSPQRQLSTKNTGRDAPAMSHNTKMEKHGSQLPKQQYEIFKNEQEVTKYRQRDGKSKITIHELDKRELIEMYNRALMVIDERSDELQTSEQQIRQLQADLERLAALCITSRHDLENFKEKVQIAQKEIKKNTSSKQALEQLTTKHEQTVDRLNRDAAKLQQEIHELKQANDDLKNRLSAVFGAKLHDNNPDIADLSDPNRSMKLAERFSELYDNEWTNCFEVLTKQKNIVEKKAIGQMLQACLTIYQDCSTNASNDLKTLTQALDRFDGETDIRLLKNLKEKRKRRFQDDIQRLRQPIEQKIIAVFKEKTNEKNVEEFWLKCIELCWLMVIQDPPVSMDARTSQLGEIFDGTVYRHYTKSGKYVEFIVWPALRLTETGSLLYKGVAQGTDKYQQYSDSVYNDVNTDEQPSSPTSRKYQNENESCTVDEIKRSDNISKTAMGDKVLENTKGQNSGTIPKHTDKRTDEVVCRTGESEMSQNQNMFNAERAVPTQGTQDSNELHKNHNFDADVNQPVNVDPLYKNTQPNKRHSEGLSDVHNHNTSKQTETTDVEQSKQDVTQPKKKPITTSTSLAQTDYGNSTQLNASGRTSTIGENNKMSGSIHKKEKELKQSLKTKNAPSASHIGKQTMTQTVSANVQQDRKAQSVKDTSFSAIVGKHTTSIPVWPSRMNNIPVDIKQVK